MLVKKLQETDIALLSQEGSGIAKRIPRGVVPKPKRFGLGTTPALRATPPDSGGEFFLSSIPPCVPESQP